MKHMDFKNKWVLITGASSGLGEEMARQLASKDKANLVLVARSADKLNALKNELEQACGISCRVIKADLSVADDVVRVFTEATQDQEIYAAILNAGITHFGEHAELTQDEFDRMLDINVKSVVHLTDKFVPYFLQKQNRGGILYIASMAGLVPVPYQAAYSGTKAFLCHFGMSLHQELIKKPVSVSVYAPGGIDTQMTRGSRLDYFSDTSFIQSVEDCASDAIKTLTARKMLKVPGAMNQAQVFMSRFAPRKLLTTITGMAYKKALEATK